MSCCKGEGDEGEESDRIMRSRGEIECGHMSVQGRLWRLLFAGYWFLASDSRSKDWDIHELVV